MNPFLDSEAARFEQLPGSLGVGLMPEANGLFRRVDCGTNIFAPPFGAEPPDFVEHFDCTTRIDFAQEMQPSRRERHTPGWDQMTQASAQPAEPRAASHLCRCLARQRGWIILIHIPAPEQRY